MTCRNEPLEATLDELKLAGFTNPVVTYGRHCKVKVDGLPPIAIARSASDVHAVNQARRLVRRLIAQNTR